ncbi:MAG: class II aldolase/adducin family protein [Rhizomicrobium sp.]
MAHAALADVPIHSVREQVGEEEWAARVELAALYRAIHMFGMTDLIANHITARVPGEAGHILVNAYGLMYDEITASSLYKIDLDGEVILRPTGGFGLNATGYIIHGAIHAVRHDLKVIIHTHSRAGTAVSAMKCGLLPISQHAALLDGLVSYHDYEGPALDFGERERLVSDLGKTNLMILRNHGLIVGGRSAGEAFLNIYRLEMACKMQVDAIAGGADNLLLIADAPLSTTREIVRKNPDVSGGRLQWEAVLRRVERTDPSYRN